MAAKLLQTLADDSPDLQKQIGCMTGIFQLFDRQQTVSGRRHGHRRLLSADPHFSNGGLDQEYNSTCLQRRADEPNHFVHPCERQRFSTESSRASISSSCSSSLSSLECSRSARPESSPFNRTVFSEAPSIDPVPKKSVSSSPNRGRASMDPRNAVKGSMYREADGGGLKKADGISRRDGLMDVNNVPADINESLKVLAKLRESPWYYNDARKLPRSASSGDQSSQSLAKDAPRFSYYGREQMQNHMSFESREMVKSTLKLKEFPRLSFDSREGSVQPLHSAGNSSLFQKSSEKIVGFSYEKHPPSVVAKLMGLEALPEPSFANNNAPVGLKKPELTKTSRRYDLSSRAGGSDSLGSPLKESESPRWRNPNGTIRPVPRIPDDPDPWRQSGGNQVRLKPGQKLVKVLPKTGDSAPSVYGEIEKRLKDLEFKQSRKDLRALKQILEAIQAKGLLESRKEDQAANYGGKRNSLGPISGMERQQLERGNHMIASGSKGSDDAGVFESPIVIMKPAKLIEKDGFVDSSMIPIEDLSNLHGFQGGIPADTRKCMADQRVNRDQAPKLTQKNSAATSDKKLKQNQIPSRPCPILKENSTLPMSRSSTLVSPRLQQKKLELERQAQLLTRPSDANKSKRISIRQTSEVASPGGRHRMKYSNLNPEDQMSEVSIGSRTPCYQGNKGSVPSDGSPFLSSMFDTKALSQSLSAGSDQFLQSKSMSVGVRNLLADKDEVFMEFPTVATEHHSPVSVLDASVHIEDDLPPVKILQNSLQSDNVSMQDAHSAESIVVNFCDAGSSAIVLRRDRCILDAKMDATSPPALEIDRKKLQSIEKLVQKLRRINSTHDEESTDYIASLCENSNPDHIYISEILLASGLLLRDLGSGRTTLPFHSSGQPINPELFFVLEQTKLSGAMKEVQTKVHRKLIFDSVNEILNEKLMGPGVLDEPWLMSAGNLARKTPTAKNLLKQLCTETELRDAKKPSYSSSYLNEEDGLEGIMWEDAVRQTGSGTDFWEETSSLILGIERLIFKDLVNDLLVGCGSRSSAKRLSRRRGL